MVYAKQVHNYARPYVIEEATMGGIESQHPTRKDCYPDGQIYLSMYLPEADFTSDKTRVTAGGYVSYSDQSSTGGAISPDTYNWQFTGGSPGSSTLKNPSQIYYYTVGVHQVSLTVRNCEGTDNETKSNYIVTVPQTPSNFQVTGNIGFSPTLSWSASTGATGYKIYRKQFPEESEFTCIATTTGNDATSYTDYSVMITGSTSDDHFRYKVTAAYYSYGESDPTNIIGVYGQTFQEHQNVDKMLMDVSRYPQEFSMSQNFPNPANPSTSIEFTLPEAADIYLAVYNLRGQVVKVLIAGSIQAGCHHVVWDGMDQHGNDLPSGLYIYRLKAGNRVFTRKLTLLR